MTPICSPLRFGALLIGASIVMVLPRSSAQEKEVAAREAQFRAAVGKVKSALVFIQESKADDKSKDEKSRKQALGAIIDPKGTVVTNHSLIKGWKTSEVVLGDGRRLPAKAVFSDPELDLAIIQVEDDKPLPYVEVGDSEKVSRGDYVLALSAPWNGPVDDPVVVTRGMIGGKVRGTKKGESLFMVDTSISPGVGPGLLINLEGKFVGLIVSRDVSPRHVNGALPSTRVKEREAEWAKEK